MRPPEEKRHFAERLLEDCDDDIVDALVLNCDEYPCYLGVPQHLYEGDLSERCAFLEQYREGAGQLRRDADPDRPAESRWAPIPLSSVDGRSVARPVEQRLLLVFDRLEASGGPRLTSTGMSRVPVGRSLSCDEVEDASTALEADDPCPSLAAHLECSGQQGLIPVSPIEVEDHVQTQRERIRALEGSCPALASVPHAVDCETVPCRLVMAADPVDDWTALTCGELATAYRWTTAMSLADGRRIVTVTLTDDGILDVPGVRERMDAQDFSVYARIAGEAIELFEWSGTWDGSD